VAIEGPLSGGEEQLAWEMEPFREYEDPEVGPIDGSGWDWYMLGGRRDGGLGGTNVVQVKMLNLDAVLAVHSGWYAELYQDNCDCPNPPFE
jgi:hypothetical protein